MAEFMGRSGRRAFRRLIGGGRDEMIPCAQWLCYKGCDSEVFEMLISRWQAPNKLSREQAQMILEAEGLEPFEETLNSQKKVSEHRHPFTEVRIVLSGELLYNISGNQVLIRAGDRIEIPANTRHSHACQGQEACFSVYAQKIV